MICYAQSYVVAFVDLKGLVVVGFDEQQMRSIYVRLLDRARSGHLRGLGLVDEADLPSVLWEESARLVRNNPDDELLRAFNVCKSRHGANCW